MYIYVHQQYAAYPFRNLTINGKNIFTICQNEI